MNLYDQSKCDRCGRFLRIDAPGVSWSQQWGYDMEGTPDLHDPHYHCSPCTDKHGIAPTNCAHPEQYHGRNELPSEEPTK